MIVIAILYAAFTLYIAFYEYTRPRALHFDQLSFFHFYFGLNLCLPMIIVFELLDGQRSQLSDYSLLAFHALRGVGVAEAGMLFVLTVLAYMSTRLGYAWMRGPVPPRAEIVEVAASDRHLNLAIWAGFSLMTIGAIYVLATSLGDDLVSGITQIVLFRAKEQFEPDFATANA